MSEERHGSEVSSASEKPSGRFVVGFDGSEGSLGALEWAVRQAELTNCALEIVAAWEWPSGFGWSSIPDNYQPGHDAQDMLTPILASLHSAHPRLTITSKVIEGHPASVLVEESRGAELLIVGCRGHGEFVGMLIGSTSEHCVANAACPVVVFR
ncbi:MAG TPA: universal stress protein [Acidimicrobiales bacterium]|nr:universal stress protein [Acidimicrobiales bacterium]